MSAHVLNNQLHILGRVAFGDYIRRRVRDPHQQSKLSVNAPLTV